MHEEGIFLGRREKFPRHHVGRHHADAFFGLLLFAHADPHIGVDHIGAAHRLQRIGRELVVGTSTKVLFRELRLKLRRRRKLLGSRERDVHAKQICPKNPRVRHITCRVTEKSDFPAAQRFDELRARPALGPTLRHRKRVGENLTRVQKIGERVDHRHTPRCRQPLHFTMIEGAHDQPMDKPRQHPRRILNRLTAAELNIVLIQKKRIAAELMNPDLKRNPRARRRLGKNHRPRLARERSRCAAGAALPFQLARQGK